MKLRLFNDLEQLFLVPIPTAKGGEPTQQDVEDHAQSPHIYRDTVTCWVTAMRKYSNMQILDRLWENVKMQSGEADADLN